MGKHITRNPLASAMLGDPAVVIRYTPNQTSERKFDGNPYSEIVCLSPYLGGEVVCVTIPGNVEGLTAEIVQEACCRLSFVRVKFSNDLAVETKGDSFNKVYYVATAGHATLIHPGQK